MILSFLAISGMGHLDRKLATFTLATCPCQNWVYMYEQSLSDYTIMDSVAHHKDVLRRILGQLPVSQQNRDVISKCICTNKYLYEAGTDVAQHSRWVLFRGSQSFAESINTLIKQAFIEQVPMVGLMSGIQLYADFSDCMEKVFETLGQSSETGQIMRIGNHYLNAHDDIHGLFESVMAKHPDNATLTSMICDQLTVVLKLQNMMRITRSDSVTQKYGGTALKMFKYFPRENCCINSASFLHDFVLHETPNAMALLAYPVSKFDLMSLMFDILRIESSGEQHDHTDNIVSVCTQKILLHSDWTAVMTLTSPEEKHPVDVILDMMLVNPNRYNCQYNGALLLEHYLDGTNAPHSVRACVQVLTRLLRQCFNGTFYKTFSQSPDSIFNHRTGNLEMTVLGVLCRITEHNPGCKDALIKYGTLAHVLDAITRLQGDTFRDCNTEYGPVGGVEQREQSCIDYACSIIEHVSTRQDDVRVYATLVDMDAITTLLHTIEYQQHDKISRRLGRAHVSALTSVHNILTGMTLHATHELTGLKYENVVLQKYAFGVLDLHRNQRTLCDFMFSDIKLGSVDGTTSFETTLETQCNILLHMSRNPAVCSEMIGHMPHFVNRVHHVLSASVQYETTAGGGLQYNQEIQTLVRISNCVNCILIEVLRLYPQCLKTPILCQEISVYMRNTCYQLHESFSTLQAVFQPKLSPV